jgi:putative flippase GtrA
VWTVRKFSDLLSELARVVRFGIIGIAATFVYAATSLLSVELLALSPLHASILGQLTATGVSYFGHSMFSFAVKKDHRTYFWRFLVIAALTFSMNGAVVWLLSDLLGIHYQISIVVVGALIPLTNYFCNRFWVFLPGLRASQSPLKPARPPLSVSRHD